LTEALRLEIGRVIKPVGLKGEIKLLLSSDYWPGILASSLLALEMGEEKRPAKILAARPAGSCAILEVEGVCSREAVDALRDYVLVFEGEELDVPEPESVLPFQVIGLEVRLIGGEKLGEVAELELLPAQPLMLVRGAGREYRIPFVEPIVREWNAKEGWIEIDPPEGLLEI